MGHRLCMTIDPGSDGTGWALWRAEIITRKLNTHLPPFEVGLIKPVGKWEVNVRQVISEIGDVLKVNAGIQDVYCENPSFWESAKGTAAAQSGSLVKLATLVGALWGVVEFAGITFHLLDVKWKGQLPKEVVVKRIYRLLKKEYPNHVADAVGMGLHMQGAEGFE